MHRMLYLHSICLMIGPGPSDVIWLKPRSVLIVEPLFRIRPDLPKLKVDLEVELLVMGKPQCEGCLKALSKQAWFCCLAWGILGCAEGTDDLCGDLHSICQGLGSDTGPALHHAPPGRSGLRHCHIHGQAGGQRQLSLRHRQWHCPGSHVWHPHCCLLQRRSSHSCQVGSLVMPRRTSAGPQSFTAATINLHSLRGCSLVSSKPP